MSSRRPGHRLPDFLGIGAAKCGTTALDAYLRQHPQVSMSRRKEPNFFAFAERRPSFRGPGDRTILNRDAIWRLEDYRRQFAHALPGQVAGDISPRYLDAPGAPERIRSLLPSVRLFAILRQPADRAWSQYSMHRRDGFEPCETLDAALEDEQRRAAERWSWGGYFARGLYARHLERYFAVFSREELRVYLYDDLVADARGLFRDLFAFVGVDPSFVPDMTHRPNLSGDLRNPLLRFLWTRPAARSLVRPLMPKVLRQRVSSWVIRRPLQRREMPADLRVRLTERYREDILRLQELVGRDLEAWLEPTRSAASAPAAASMPRSP